ncbi:hypothetical protein BD408DRAFT_398604 [Parasitella parasitica]|nr:hypothetical protein BD408DRAFT_398604 [Parasitella parasitica]
MPSAKDILSSDPQTKTIQYEYESDAKVDGFNKFMVVEKDGLSAFDKIFPVGSTHEQVKILCLLNTQATAEYILALPERFPALREFKWIDSHGTNIKELNVDEEKAKLWENVAIFEEEDSYGISEKILENNGFLNLTKLSVDYYYDKDTNGKLLIKHLDKAPILKEFKVVDMEMSLSDLALLTKNAKKLETLHLSNITHSKDNEKVDAIVAENLKQLKLGDMKREDMMLGFKLKLSPPW